MKDLIIKKRLTSSDDNSFKDFWSLYEASFPQTSRRLPATQKFVLADEKYFLDIWLQDDELIGFLSWWSYAHYRYVEYYAISPAQRSRGMGSQLFKDFVEADKRPIILEVDPTDEEILRRRVNFYKRLSLVENNDIHHACRSYYDGQTMTPLKVLSYPTSLSKALYDIFRHNQDRQVLKEFGYLNNIQESNC